jgi:predicted N-acetyltransferase YhbS
VIAFDLATRADDAGIRRLLATNAMPGRIRVRFEREPDYFAGCGEDTQVLVARDGARVVGVACRSIRKLYVNGVAEDVGYLGQLRVDRAYRGQLLTARGYRVMRELHADGRASGYYTTIVDGNAQAEGVLVRRSRSVMPRYRFVEKLYPLACGVRSAVPRSVGPRSAEARSAEARSAGILPAATLASSRQGTREEPGRQDASGAAGRMPALRASALRASALCDYNLSPAYLSQGDTLTLPGASAALHDQRAYKQTVIDGYDTLTNLVRPFYNLVARIQLPKPNTPLNHAYVTHFQAEDAHAARELIEEILRAAAMKGVDHVLLGFTESDPFLSIARTFKPIEYTSSIYTVAFDDGDDFHDRLLARPRAVDLSAL